MPAITKTLSQPSNENDEFVWRYMDLARFISLISTGHLYFSRPDQFEDTFEGFIRGDLPGPFAAKHLTINGQKSKLYPSTDLTKWLNKWRYVNCWHLNEFESAAMWKLYGKNDESVAIKSRYSTLVDCFGAKVEIGLVKYVDFNKLWSPDPTSLTDSIMNKRKSFSHENEVRLVVYHPEFPAVIDGEPDFEKANIHTGINVAVELHKLIEAIYISPSAPHWFSDVVKSVVGKYELNSSIPIIKSDLYRLPI